MAPCFLIGTETGMPFRTTIYRGHRRWTTAFSLTGYQGGARFRAGGAKGIVVTIPHPGYSPSSRSPGTMAVQLVSSRMPELRPADAGDIDVNRASQSVRGYRIGTVGAIRSALEPLQAAWPFDVRQHGYKIQFVARAAHPSSPSRRPTSMRAMRERIPACRSRHRAKWTASCRAG